MLYVLDRVTAFFTSTTFKIIVAAVVALIVAPVLKLSQRMHRAMYLVIVATAFAIHWLGWSPVYILLAAALGGVAWELSHLKKLKR